MIRSFVIESFCVFYHHTNNNYEQIDPISVYFFDGTVKELRHRNAENLHERMLKMNDLRGLCDRVPSVKKLEKMIAEAANLEPVMTY